MGILGAIWGLVGITIILACAIVRVYGHAVEAWQLDWTPWQWVVAVIWCLFMLLAEGYRGFQKQFSPRVVARARYLIDHPRPLHVLLAPFFCIAYFHATRRRKIVSWSLTIGIILLIVIVHSLPQPWRGIIDFGVVLGLAYGLLWIFIYAAIAFGGGRFNVDPEVCDPAEADASGSASGSAAAGKDRRAGK